MPAIAIEIRYFDGRREERKFTQATITIGREGGDIVLGDPQSSARHGEIHLNPEGATYRDLNSTNGSYLETGERISGAQPLRTGMEIRVGRSAVFIREVQVQAALGPSGTVVIESPFASPPHGAGPAAERADAGRAAAAGVGGGVGPIPEAASPNDAAPGAIAVDGGHPANSAPVDPVEFVTRCLKDYRPLWLEGAKVLGVFLVPLALVEGLLGYVPVLGAIVGALLVPVSALFMALLGFGAQAEFAMRTAAGLPATAQQVWRVQFRRMFPWLLGLIVPALVSVVGCFLTMILFGTLLLQVYMVEDKRMLDVNLRSFELLKKDWFGVLGPILLVVVPMIVAHVIIMLVFGALPFVGGLLAALAGAVYVAVVSPFASFVQFRVYYAVRYRHERQDAAGEVRAKLGA